MNCFYMLHRSTNLINIACLDAKQGKPTEFERESLLQPHGLKGIVIVATWVKGNRYCSHMGFYVGILLDEYTLWIFYKKYV